MLQRIEFRNYRSLRHVDLDFEPLTVLVGPNGSGKSSVLRAVALFSAQGISLQEEDCWQHERSRSPEITLQFEDGEARWNPASGTTAVQGARAGRFQPRLMHLDLQALRRPNVLEEVKSLSPDGGNLTNLFATLTRRAQDELVSEFRRFVPTFGDIDEKPTSGGNHDLRFQDRWNPSVWYSPREVSDGSILTLAYLITRYQAPQVDLLAIEEPGRGLHPYLLEQLIAFIRAMTRGDGGKKPVQIVLASHSAELLDHMEPREVRFLRLCEEDGSTMVEGAPHGQPNWQEYFRTYEESLGGAWLSGGLGGVPGA